MNSLKDYMKNVNTQPQADSSADKAATSGSPASRVPSTADMAGKIRAAAGNQTITTPTTQTSAPAADQTAAGSSASSGMTSLKDYMAKKRGTNTAGSTAAAAQPSPAGIPRMKTIWSDPKARQTVLGNMGKDFEGYDGSWDSAKSFLPGMEKGLGLQSSMIDTWQKEAEDLSRSLTAQYKQLEQMQADPMTTRNPYAAKRYSDAIDRYNKELEEYKAYVADIETATGKYGTHYEKYKSAGDVYAGGQKSLPKWQQKVDSVLGADRTQVTDTKTDWWKLIKGTVSKGANQVNQSFWNTVNMFLGGAAEEIHTLGTEALNSVIDTVNLIPGVNISNIDGGKNSITRAYEDAQKGFQQSQEKYSANANSSRAAQIIDKLGTSTVAAIPMALEAIILKPYYLAKAAQGVTTAGLQYFSTLQNAKGLEAFSTMAVEGMRKLFENPQFWTSYLNVAGDGYEDAKKDGMKETDALIYGTVNGFFNAMIEIGGADEALGGIQNLPMRLDQMKEEAGKKQLVEWFKDSVLGEGLEEVQQGAFERGMKAASTPDNGLKGLKEKWFSVDPTNQDAVFNPFTAGQEFLGGAVVGGILGGAQVGTSKALQGLTLPSVTEEETETKRSVKPEAERPTAQQFYDFMMRNGDENMTARNQDYIFHLFRTDEGDAWIGQIYEAGDDGRPKAAIFETAERTKENAARAMANQTVAMELTRQAETAGTETPSTGSTLDSRAEPAVESVPEVKGLSLPTVEPETPARTKTPASGTAPQPTIEGGTINGESEQFRPAAAGSLPAAGTAGTAEPAAGTAEPAAGTAGPAATGDNIPDGDGGRLHGEGSGVEDRRLGEGSGRVQKNWKANQAAAASKRRINAQTAGETVRLSAQEIGVPNGTAQKNLTVYPENLWDDELKAIDADTFSKTGQHVTFVIGSIDRTTSDGTVVRSKGLRFPDGREIVRVDHTTSTASQIHDHEDWHRMEAEDPGLHSAAINALLDAVGSEQFNKIYDKYVTALWGTMNLPEHATNSDIENVCRDIEEEMLADIHGGINFQGIGADRYKSIIDGVIVDRSPVSQTRAATASTTGPPKFSFAGQRAKSANIQQLAEAEELERAGTPMEEIRKGTGWFRSMDGKWRFELSDDGMTFRMRPENIPNTTTLGELIDHEELFAAYPDMRNMRVDFLSMPEYARGNYNLATNSIDLNENMRSDFQQLAETLVHEIQHAIQSREGFARGSSVAYWDNEILNGLDTRRKPNQEKLDRTTEAYNTMVSNNPALARAIEDLDAEKPAGHNWEFDEEANEMVDTEQPAWDAWSQKQKRLERIFGDAYWQLQRLKLKMESERVGEERNSWEMYQDTAGEVEARNAADRRMLSDYDREMLKPVYDYEDAVFTDPSFPVRFSADERAEEPLQRTAYDSEWSEDTYSSNLQNIAWDLLDYYQDYKPDYWQRLNKGNWTQRQLLISQISPLANAASLRNLMNELRESEGGQDIYYKLRDWQDYLREVEQRRSTPKPITEEQNGGIPESVAKAYLEDVTDPRGGQGRAGDIFEEYVLRAAGSDITPFIYTSNYNHNSPVAKAVKTKDPYAVTIAAEEMQAYVPNDAVLIPMPGHNGRADDTLTLANAVAALYNQHHPNNPVRVLDALAGKERASQYLTKKTKHRSLTLDEMGIHTIADIPADKFPVFIDNVVASGQTATAAQKAVGRGMTLAFAYGNRTTPVPGLKLANPITYDDDGRPIPITERFNRDSSDIRYSADEENDYPKGLTLPSVPTAEDTESTEVDTNPEEHTPEQQRIIEEYQAATDEDLIEFAKEALAAPGNRSNSMYYALTPVSDRAVSDILNITGVDATGFRTAIQGDMVKHLYNRHGTDGDGARTLTDLNDVGRIQYVLDNYDTAERGIGSTGYRDAKNKAAKTVVFSKAVDGTYYVVEAVPDTKAKTAYIVTAYMSKNKTATERAGDANAPTRTSETGRAPMSVSENSIPNPERDVNRENTVELDSEGNELSDKQQEFFKDSKVRDEEGGLIPVYHGTNAEFTVFDKRKQGTNYWQGKGGFFFTDRKRTAYNYASLHGGDTGGVTVKAYLNLVNPYIIQAPSSIRAADFYDSHADDIMIEANFQDADGIIVKGSGENLYVAFDSEQIKRIDNKTPTQDPDIRFSADDQTPAERRREAEERERLAAAGASPDVQPKTETPKATPKESKPVLAKKNLRNQMFAAFSIPEGRRAEIGAIIDSYADRLFRHGEITQSDRDALLDRLYSEGVMTVKHDDSGLEEHPRIYISPEVRAEFGEDWNNFRRRAFANGIYFTNNNSDRGADSWQQTLAGKFAGIYDENTDMRTFLETLVQIAQDSKDEHMTLDEYNSYIARQEGVDEEQLRDREITNLERQLDNALRNFAEQANLEVYYRSREDRIRQEERRNAYAGRKDMQARQAIKEAKEKERRNQMAQQHRENRELREMQQKTLKQLQWLSKNRWRMPEELASTAKEILSDLDIYAAGAARATNYSKRYEATWEDIAKIYKEARATDPNFFPSQDLERIVARLDNAKIADLDPAALADLYKAAVGLRTEFYNKQNLINDQNHALFADVYADTREEMAKAPKDGKDNEIIKSLNLEMMTPANVLQMLFGWDKSSTGNRIAQQLVDGERAMKAYEVGAKAILDDFIEEHQDWIKKADGQGKDAIWYEIEVPELLELRMGDKPIFGKTVKVYLTPAQKVQLAIESKNKDNLRHMLGGRTFVNKDLYSKGKRAEAFAQGTTIKLAPETVESIVKDLTPEERELADILGNKYYNDYSGKKIDEVSVPLYGYKKTMGGWYAPIFTNQNYTNNEAGLFDVTAEGVGNLKQRQVSKNPSYNISAFDAFERNINMTKRFVGMAIPARNWQTLMNWQGDGTSWKDELTHQWGNEYKEYIQNLITRLQAGGSQGLKEAKLEKATNRLLGNYITSVFGANPGIVFKQAASFPQFAAVMGWDTMPTVGQLRGVDTDLMRTYTPELAYRMLGYSTPETATLKENPSRLDTNKVTKFLLRGGAITWMDGATVQRAWPWAENYVRKNFPELEAGSEQDISEGRSAFYKKVAEVFNEAVGTTQPMYDEMHRPNIMKDSRGVQRAFTMFKTVPLQQYNTMRKAAGEAAAAKEEYKRAQSGGNDIRKQEAESNYKDASKRMANAVTATIASVMLFNLIGFVDQLWRNRGKKYRDDEGELTLNSVMQGLLSDSIDSVTGMVIYGKELTDLITNLVTGEKWYGIEIPGGEQLDEIIDQISTAADTIRKVISDVADITAGGGDPTEYWHRHAGDFAGAIKDVAFTFSKYYNGLSAENIEKYIMGTLMTISPQTYTMLQDYFDTPAKYNLKGLSGEQFTQRAGDLFGSRGINVTDGMLRQLEQMYNDGYTDVIPSETAGTVTVNGTKYSLGANAQQIYDSTFAEYVNSGLEEILAGGLNEREASKAVQTLYNYAAAKAKEAAAADQLSEADARALKKSTAVVDEVMEHGVTLPEWSLWKGITSEKFPDEDEKGEERSANTVEKLGMLRDFDVSDETKKALYGYLRGGYEMETEAGNPTNYAKMLDLTSRNMTIDEFIDWSIAYAGADKETDKLEALRDFNASEAAKQDLFGFIKGGREMETETGSPTQYAKMIAATKAGLTTDEYCDWLIDTADMKKDNEKLDYLAGTDFTDQEKLALIGNLMGTDMKTASGNPTQYAKIKALNNSGISIDDCIDLKLTDALDRYYNAQTKNKVASGDSNMTGLIITIEDELDKLKPANGDTQVDDFQKFEVIYRYGKQNQLTDKELLDICRVYASYDSYIPKLELSMKHNVGIDTYCQARTAMRQVSMANDNNITITTKEATAALNKMIESGKITKEEAAVLYQLQQKNWSYKNNPFDRSIGEQVYNELNSGTSGSSGSGSSSSGSGAASGSAASKPSLDVSGLKLPTIPGNRTVSQDNAQQEQQSMDTQSGYPAGLSLPSPYGSGRQSGSGNAWTPQLPEQQEPLQGLSLPSLPGKGMYDRNSFEDLIAINEARGDNYIIEGEPVPRYEYDRDYYNRGYDPVRTGEVRMLDPLYYEEGYYPEPILSPQDIRETGTEGRRTSIKAERRGQALGSAYRVGTGRSK